VRADHAAEVVGIEVYTAAAGQPVTMSLVKSVIAELTSHQPGCDCGRCTGARQTNPARVYVVASAWQSSVAATRRRALR
jgi:hypothetical protein